MNAFDEIDRIIAELQAIENPAFDAPLRGFDVAAQQMAFEALHRRALQLLGARPQRTQIATLGRWLVSEPVSSGHTFSVTMNSTAPMASAGDQKHQLGEMCKHLRTKLTAIAYTLPAAPPAAGDQPRELPPKRLAAIDAVVELYGSVENSKKGQVKVRDAAINEWLKKKGVLRSTR